MSYLADNPILLARELGPDAVSLAVGEGEIVALTGACDEAFLRALAGADPTWRGGLWLKGEPLHKLRPAARLRFAYAHCAIAPRTGKLLPELSVAENTALPLLLAGLGRQEARRRALRWLERLDVIACADWRIGELSLGEMRRVALARALVLDPAVLLAEDPTEDLGLADRFHLLRILRAAAGTHHLSIVLASNDAEVLRWADRRIAGPVRKTEPEPEVDADADSDADADADASEPVPVAAGVASGFGASVAGSVSGVGAVATPGSVSGLAASSASGFGAVATPGSVSGLVTSSASGLGAAAAAGSVSGLGPVAASAVSGLAAGTVSGLGAARSKAAS